MPATLPSLSAFARLESARASYLLATSPANFDRTLITSTSITSARLYPNATSGTATYVLTFPLDHSNAMGMIHGGAISALCDNLMNCTIAVVARPGFWEKGGVTRGLEVRYLRSIKAGEEVVVSVDVVGVGARRAVLRGVVRREGKGNGGEGEVCVVFGGELGMVGGERAKL